MHLDRIAVSAARLGEVDRRAVAFIGPGLRNVADLTTTDTNTESHDK